MWPWISWQTLPGEGLPERAKDEEGERVGFPDGRDLPLGSGTEGIGCFGHTKTTGMDSMPHPCGDPLAGLSLR